MFAVGVRASYRASQFAAPGMIARGRGLIVNISFWAAQKHIGNVAYGVSKAATDKLTADMAHELRKHGVSVLSLYPGLVRTELVMQASEFLDLSNSESPEFTGHAIAHLYADGERLRRTGSVVVAAAYAREVGFCDIDGSPLYQREDDRVETVRARLAQQLGSLADVVAYYRDLGKLGDVDGRAPVTAVTEALVAEVASAAGGPA